jgi:hypothetical protein
MSESAYKAARRDDLDAVYAALADRGETLAGWARRRGHALEAAYKAVSRYAGRPGARPRGLDTLLILRDLRADLAHAPAAAALLPAVPHLRVVR